MQVAAQLCLTSWTMGIEKTAGLKAAWKPVSTVSSAPLTFLIR